MTLRFSAYAKEKMELSLEMEKEKKLMNTTH